MRLKSKKGGNNIDKIRNQWGKEKGSKIEQLNGTNTESLNRANKIVKFPSSLNKRKERTHYKMGVKKEQYRFYIQVH